MDDYWEYNVVREKWKHDVMINKSIAIAYSDK